MVCRICNHPHGAEITRRVLTGELSIYKAAKMLGVGYHEMERHVYEHTIKVEKPEAPPEFESYDEMLRDIINRLYGLIYKMSLSSENDPTSLKLLPQLIRELRGTINDLHQIASLLDKKKAEKILHYEKIFELLIDQVAQLPEECRNRFLNILNAIEEEGEDIAGDTGNVEKLARNHTSSK